MREENLKKIEEHMEEISRLGAACRLTREELLSMMEFILEDYQ